MRLLVTDGRLSQAQYSKADGSIPFTNPVIGVTPTASNHLATKGYVDNTVIALEWQNSIKDQHLTSPPVAVAGDRYIVAAVASGLWTGYEKYIAEYDGSDWSFEAPTEGMAVWMDDEDCVYVYSGAAWVKLGTFVDHGNLIGLADNDHTQYILHSLGTAIGDMLYATGVGTFGVRTAVAAGSILASAGIGAAPVWTDSPSIAGNVTVSTGDILSVFKLGGTPINNRQASIQFNTSSTAVSWAIQYGTSIIGSLSFAPSTTVAGLSFGNPALFMDSSRNVLFGGKVSMGSGATSAIGLGIGVGPGSSPADMAQMWVEDLNGDGTAGFKIRNEDGTNRTIVGAPNSVVGDLLYASAVNTWSLLTAPASGNVLISTGLTTAPAWGKINLSTHLHSSSILGSANGGTGSGYTKFDGPVTSEKTFTLPNANATLLYSGGALGTPISGTLTNCTFPTLNQNTTGSAGSLTGSTTFDLALSDDTAQGDKFTGTAGEALAQWEVVYLKSDGKYWKAKGDANTTTPACAVATAAIEAEASGVFMSRGIWRDDGGTGFVVGSNQAGLLYLSEATAGALTNTAPAVAGNQVQILGYSKAAKIRWFEPNMMVLEIQ